MGVLARQRSLDSTSVTVVGCGDVRLATAAARGVDVRDVERAVHEALGLGIDLVDVSEEPDAERLCGDAIRSLRLRDTVVLASRVPTVPPIPGRPNRDLLPERLPILYVQQCVEATLRSTRLDALPLAQLAIRPAWRTSAAWAELAGTCARLVREGKVMRWGALVDDDLDGAGELDPWLVSLSVEYSACARAAQPLAAKRLVLARRPLAGGGLAGALGPGIHLAANDDRRALDDATLERVAAKAAMLAPLVRREPVAARSCDAAKAALERGHRPPYDLEATTLAELAIRYVIDHGAIALPRLHRSQHLAEAIAAASAPPLSRQTLDRLDEVLTS